MHHRDIYDRTVMEVVAYLSVLIEAPILNVGRRTLRQQTA